MGRDASAEKVEWRDTNGPVQHADNVGECMDRDLSLKTKSVQSFASDSG